MDIKQLINLLPSYYKEFDSYKVKGKGLLERFLELIGDALYKVKESIDNFLNVISIDNTDEKNLDLLAKQLGSIPFTGSNSIESLKLTNRQRREIISMSTWFIKNRGSKEFFITLFKKLHNKENNLSLSITENVSNQNPLKENIMDYDTESDSTCLDVDYTLQSVPTVIYKVDGNIPKSVYKTICDMLMEYSPFNVTPLVYIKGEFQSRLDLPYQLYIEYFDTVNKRWKTSDSTFNVGQNTNYFRVVAYNNNTHKEVAGVRFTTKYKGNKSEFTGENKGNILVTPYYYEIDSLPIGLNNWTRTFVPEPTIPQSGENIGTEVSVEYIKIDNSLQYTDDISIKSLFDTLEPLSSNTWSITKGRYHTSVVGVTAVRTYSNGIKRYLGVVNSNTGEVVWPTTVWFDKVNGKISYTKPVSGTYEKLENVSIFHIFKESTHIFYNSLNKSKSVTLNVENDKSVQPLQPGKILVRERNKELPWTDNLVINVTGDSVNSITMPEIDILVLNPNLPVISFEDDTQLTPNDVIKLLQGKGITYGTNTINGKHISSRPDNILAFSDWKDIINNDTKWLISGTVITGDSWKNSDSAPVTLPSLGTFKLMSKTHPTIINPATVQYNLVPRTILKFYGYDTHTRYISEGNGKAQFFTKIRVDETNDLTFDLRDVVVKVTTPQGDTKTLTLNPDNPSVFEIPEYSILYEQVDENFNVVAITTSYIGSWFISIKDTEGSKVLSFEVKRPLIPEPTLPEPYYLRLVPIPGTETAENTTWSTSDSYSSITMNNLDDRMFLQVEVLGIDRELLRQRYDIYLTDPDDITEEGSNQESYTLNKPGRYIFKVGDIIHTLEIRDGSTHLPDDIQPVVKSTPSKAIFNNSNGVLDSMSIDGTNKDHYQYDPETGGIIINLSINTDQEWTATLENT